MTFTPALYADGTAIVNVSLSDDGGTSNGGDDISDSRAFSITVNVVSEPETVYAAEEGDCGENTPCFKRLQDAVDFASTAPRSRSRRELTWKT